MLEFLDGYSYSVRFVAFITACYLTFLFVNHIIHVFKDNKNESSLIFQKISLFLVIFSLIFLKNEQINMIFLMIFYIYIEKIEKDVKEFYKRKEKKENEWFTHY